VVVVPGAQKVYEPKEVAESTKVMAAVPQAALAE
jgi:hypothetical protein